MVKGRRNPDDKLKNIEDEVDRLIRRREKSKETMPEVLYVPEGKKRKEEYIKPEFVPKPKTKKNRVFKKTDFLRTGIAKPVAIILVISMILTGIQLVSLISTGETIIVLSDFGIPEEFENAKQEFERESEKVKEKAEENLSKADWGVEKLPEKNINYDPKSVIEPKPEWKNLTPIFDDIEKAGITTESTYVSWTHTTTEDFENNCSSLESEHVEVSDEEGGMITLEKRPSFPHPYYNAGIFTSKPLNTNIDNAVLKNVTWHYNLEGESKIILIIEVSDTSFAGSWKAIWASTDITQDWVKNLFGTLVLEFASGKYFRYRVGFSSGGVYTSQFEDISLSVTTRTLDRKYWVFTYYGESKTPVITEGDAGIAPDLHLLESPTKDFIELFIQAMGWSYVWVPINVDQSGSNDIEVTLNLKGSFKDGELIPPDDVIVNLTGGLEIRVRKINNLTLPLDVYFIKAVSYDNKNYIWIFRFYFSPLPQDFKFFMNSDNIEGKMKAKEHVKVKPPYTVNWTMSNETSELGIGIGYAKVEPIVKANYWLDLNLKPGIKAANLYYEETAERMDLTWSGSGETNFSGCYREENLYVEFKIDNLPLDIFLSIGNGFLTYNASAPLVLSFEAYDFDDASISYANLSLLSNITITGGFGIAETEDVDPDPSDTFIGNVLNHIIAKIKSRMQRVRKTLSSIPEAVYTKEGLRFKSEKPANITLGHLKGRVENNVIHCERLNLSGNYVGILNPSIQACLKNVTELNLSFGRNITLMLKRSGAREPLEGIYASWDTKISVNIPELPSELLIKGTAQELNYLFSEPVTLNILAKTLDYALNYKIDANIKNITSGVFERKDQNISLRFGEPVEIECSVGKGQLYRMSGNHFFANTSEKTMSLRLGNLTSLHAGEHLGLTLSEEYPLKMLLETNFTSGKILVKNLPRIFNVSLPSSPISLPEMENVTIATMHDLLSSVANTLNKAMENISKITNASIIERLIFSYESVSSPVIIANLTSGKNLVSWCHGITLKKSNLTLDMKIYLKLPKKATFGFDRRNGLELRYRFENWNPTFNWVSADLEIENKNLFALLNISDLENGEGIIKMVEEEQVQPPGNVTPPTTGELNLSIELFLTSIPQELNLTIKRGSNLSLSWNASSSIKGIYLNMIREDKGNLYPSHFITRNTPVKADFTITSASKATLFQVPEINVNTSDKLDFNLKLDAGLVGGRGDFLLYAEELECFSLKAHDNTVTINSMVDKLLFRVSNTSLGGMKEIEILSLDLKSLTFTANFIFGKFPVLEVNCDAKETEINLIPSISTPFGEKNSVALTDFSFLSLNIRKNSVRITDTRTHYITVAPILSLWW